MGQESQEKRKRKCAKARVHGQIFLDPLENTTQKKLRYVKYVLYFLTYKTNASDIFAIALQEKSTTGRMTFYLKKS